MTYRKSNQPNDKSHLKGPFITALQERPNVAAACETVDISRETAYNWRESDEQFARDWDACFLRHIDTIEENALERAMRARHDVMAIFMMKSWKPERYGDNKTVNVGNAGGQPFKIESSELSEAELQRRVRALIEDDSADG